MPAVTGASSSAYTSGTASTLTFAHTATGDPLYVAVTIWGIVTTVTAITYGGVALTKIGRVIPPQAPNDYAHEWWYLTTPVAGTANVVITASGSQYLAAGARNVSGGESPSVASLVGFTTSGPTTGSLDVVSASGALVLDHASSWGNNQTFVPGAGQTLDYVRNNQTNSDVKPAGSNKAGAAIVTMGWTFTVGVSWTISGLSVPSASVVSVTLPASVSGLGIMDVQNIWRNVTPSDTVDAPFVRLWIGGAGNIAAVAADGTVVTFSGVRSNTFLPIFGRRINATNTTATNIVALRTI